MTFFWPILCMKAKRVFFIKKLKRMTWEHCVFRDWRFFYKTSACELLVSQRMDAFLRIYGHENIDFFRKKSKNGVSYWLFWPMIECSFDRIGVFLTNYVHDGRGFFMRNLKIWHSSTVFLREDASFDKILAWELHVLATGRFFHKILAREQWFVNEKSWKKCILLTFVANNI